MAMLKTHLPRFPKPIHVWFGLLCCGVDHRLETGKKRQFVKNYHYGLSDVKLDNAWLRVRKNETSFRHEWVNFITEYITHEVSQRPAKLIGTLLLHSNFYAFCAGAVLVGLLNLVT